MPHFESAKTIEYKGHMSKVHSVAWNCQGSKLASGSTDHTARIWHIEKESGQKDSFALRGHTASVDQLRWHSKHPDVLATASADKSVRVWDTRMATCAHKIDTEGENINICWRPTHDELAVGSKDDLITFIDVRAAKIHRKLQFSYEVNEITWNKTADLFFLTTGQGNISILDYGSLKEVHSLDAHTANCYCIEFEPNGRYFATGSADALVSLWDAQEYLCLRTFSRLDWPIRTLSFSFDGELIAAGSEDLFIDISSAKTGESVYRLSCGSATNTVAWHPKRHLLAYAGDAMTASATTTTKASDRHALSSMDGGTSLKIFGFTTPQGHLL